MSTGEVSGVCALCGCPGSLTIEPLRRTLARGSDPSDQALSIIAVLPDVVLCQEHADQVALGKVSIGWCDNEPCRLYGEVGMESPCGDAFKALGRHK